MLKCFLCTLLYSCWTFYSSVPLPAATIFSFPCLMTDYSQPDRIQDTVHDSKVYWFHSRCRTERLVFGRGKYFLSISSIFIAIIIVWRIYFFSCYSSWSWSLSGMPFISVVALSCQMTVDKSRCLMVCMLFLYILFLQTTSSMEMPWPRYRKTVLMALFTRLRFPSQRFKLCGRVLLQVLDVYHSGKELFSRMFVLNSFQYEN